MEISNAVIISTVISVAFICKEVLFMPLYLLMSITMDLWVLLFSLF